MDRVSLSIAFAVGLFAGMLLLVEVGLRLGRRRKTRADDEARPGLGAVEGSVFGLLGLLVAFTFSGAATRFDARRHLIVQEANAIGTAWMRLQLLDAADQPALRELFRQYVDRRLAAYELLPDVRAAKAEIERANALQDAIWIRAVSACQKSPSPLSAQLVPALNEMFDVATTRSIAARLHPPGIIFGMLGLLALMSSLFIGYAMAGGRRRSWVHILGFALIMAATTYVILDLEHPRLGLIRVDSFDHVLIQLHQQMQQ
jgi:hypothetical protein